MLTKLRWTILSLMLILGVALLVSKPLISWEWPTWRKTVVSQIQLRQSFPELNATKSDGSTVRLRALLTAKWTYVRFMSVPDPAEVDYMNVLLGKYAHYPLQFVVITDKATPHSSPPVSDDQRLIFLAADFSKILRDGQTSQLCLVDPSGVTRFSYPGGLETRGMRLLTERYLSGHIQYEPPGGISKPQKGEKTPRVQIVRLSDRKPFWLSDLTKGSTVIFFQAYCTTCGLDAYVHQLSTLEEGPTSLGQRRVYAVFSRTFGEAPILAAIQEDRIRPDVYIASEYIDQWESAYYLGARGLQVPWVIPISASGYTGDPVPYDVWYTSQIALRKGRSQL